MATKKFQMGELLPSLTVLPPGRGEISSDGAQLHLQSGKQISDHKNPPVTDTTSTPGRWTSQPADAA